MFATSQVTRSFMKVSRIYLLVLLAIWLISIVDSLRNT